jgi:pSer/pThr/pTyr-binding forkhead associated (FHA) protein
VGAVVELHAPVTTFGRHPDNDVVLASPLVSAHHLRVHVGERLEAEDLGSTNGTYVNEERVQGRHPLAGGDQLRVGDVTFQVHLSR